MKSNRALWTTFGLLGMLFIAPFIATFFIPGLEYLVFWPIALALVCSCVNWGSEELAIKNAYENISRRLGWEPTDPSLITRVVQTKTGEEEYIIKGKSGQTFRLVLLRNWPFRNIRKSDSWILIDERGNDITDTRMDEYDGIVYIETKYAPAPVIEKTDKREKGSDEFSTMDSAVKFYD